MGDVAEAVKTFARRSDKDRSWRRDMTYLKITQTKDGLAVVLNEELQQLLGVADGGELRAEVSEDGNVMLVGQDSSCGARRERGRAFIQRYQKTFNALAK
jgi:hypothetical protein